MRRYLLLLCMLSGLWFSSLAQEHQRWTIGLSGSYARATQESQKSTLNLYPTIRYHITPNIHLGLRLNLPLTSPEIEDEVAEHTSALELQAGYSFETPNKIKFHFSSVGLIGTTGAYTNTEVRPIGGSGPYQHIKYRWLIGIRPSISYHFSSQWSIELGLGFWGYRSQKERLFATLIRNGVNPEGAWGFDSSGSWGNALRLGICYSF